MTSKQRRIKLAKRRYHQSDSRVKYWIEFNKPRSVMESLRPRTVLPPDEIGFTMTIRR